MGLRLRPTTLAISYRSGVIDSRVGCALVIVLFSSLLMHVSLISELAAQDKSYPGKCYSDKTCQEKESQGKDCQGRGLGQNQVEAGWAMHVIDGSSRGADGVKLSDINGDGNLDIVTGWEEGGVTRVYINPGPAQVRSEWPRVEIGRTPAVEDAVFADLDRDGNIDVISCCEGRERSMYIHWAPSVEDVLNPEAWQQVPIPAAQKKMQWMYAWPMDVDSRNGIDVIAAGKNDEAELGWFEVPADARAVDDYVWHPITPVGWVMSIWMRDMDSDGDLDIVISDRYRELRGCRWLENPGAGERLQEPWPNHFMGAQDKEVLSMDLVDIDSDGLEDAIVATKDYKILILRRINSAGLEWETIEVPADYEAGNTRAVRVGDLDLDGHLDLAITTWNSDQKHGVFWLKRIDESLDQWSFRPISGVERGIKYDRIELIDLDDDGDLDLMTCEERQDGAGMGVIWYENPEIAD